MKWTVRLLQGQNFACFGFSFVDEPPGTENSVHFLREVICAPFSITNPDLPPSNGNVRCKTEESNRGASIRLREQIERLFCGGSDEQRGEKDCALDPHPCRLAFTNHSRASTTVIFCNSNSLILT